ncbi:MAG: HD domain-containing protein [Romboutsia sp.]|nr:HD domain-containing protein [Romboutsia sp.]
MYSLTKDEKEKLHNEICILLKSIERPEADIEGLIHKLEESDFFEAPASSKFHNCFSGGLADHSLNVYYNLKRLVEIKHLETTIPKDSIIICGLLHDMSKINYYEKTVKNKKIYTESGSKWDNLGTYDWVSEEGWSVKSEKDRFIYGNHEETSEFMVRQYIPLKVSESVAILNHHGGKGHDSTGINISGIYHRYPLANLLHVADMIATFTDEEN